VAAMEGPALGGGAELALACDLRVMGENSYFSFVQLRVGIVPGWGGGRRLAEIVGWKRALGLFATTARVPAAEALRLGLADRLTVDGQAFHEARELVEEMATLPPLAVRALKPLLRRPSTTPGSEADGFEADTFGRLWATDDHEEAIASLIDRRPGVFHGR
jgi:enoyl-CoA hydratase/carnithine racemase